MGINTHHQLLLSDGETSNVVFDTLIYQEFRVEEEKLDNELFEKEKEIELLSEKLQGAEMELAKLKPD